MIKEEKNAQTHFAIEDVLPHKAPMILIDKLVSFDENNGWCTQQITKDSLLYNDALQGVPSYVGIEYMAQSIAAYANANELINKRPVKIGFLVSTRKFNCKETVFGLGLALTIHVEKLFQDDSGLTAFHCKIMNNDEEMVSATINVFQPENPAGFIANQG